MNVIAVAGLLVAASAPPIRPSVLHIEADRVTVDMSSTFENKGPQIEQVHMVMDYDRRKGTMHLRSQRYDDRLVTYASTQSGAVVTTYRPGREPEVVHNGKWCDADGDLKALAERLAIARKEKRKPNSVVAGQPCAFRTDRQMLGEEQYETKRWKPTNIDLEFALGDLQRLHYRIDNGKAILVTAVRWSNIHISPAKR